MYSTDRREALSYTLSCLRDMPLYDQCQKTIVVDGKIDIVPEDWQVIQVPRIEEKFCWGRMWDAGVCSSKHEKILYLDSDRLLPMNYLQVISDSIEHDTFVFTSRHYSLTMDLSLELCKSLLALNEIEPVLLDPKYFGKLRYDPRFGQAYHGPGKNVMSGSTGFTKKTYFRLKGVDHWYCGHGAYADTDFHMCASVGGCRFIDVGLLELHCRHPKKIGEIELENKQLHLLGLNNFIYYCDKWHLPILLAESLAGRIGIDRPQKYVNQQLALIKEASKG